MVVVVAWAFILGTSLYSGVLTSLLTTQYRSLQGHVFDYNLYNTYYGIDN